MSIVKGMCTRFSELERLGNAWVSTATRLVPPISLEQKKILFFNAMFLKA